VNGRELGRQIARAAAAAEMQEQMAEAVARALARLAVIDLVAILPAEAFNHEGGMVGSFATGGLVRSPFDGPVPERVVIFESTPTGLDAERMRDAYRRQHPEFVDMWSQPGPPQWPADVLVDTPRKVPHRG